MVTHFGGKGPGRRIRNAPIGISTTVGEGRCRDLYVVAGVRVQVRSRNDGYGLACDAYLRTGHINRVDRSIVIRATNHNIACALNDVFIELHY